MQSYDIGRQEPTSVKRNPTDYETLQTRRAKTKSLGPAQAVTALLGVITLSCSDEPGVFDDCDIRTEACQQLVAMEVARLRGTEYFTPPSVRVISESQLEEEFYGPPSEPKDPTPYEQVLALLGLLPKTSTRKDAQRANLSNILAFYSSSKKEVIMVDRGAPVADPRSIRTLAHEMVHAIQDQETDLRAIKRSASTIEAKIRIRTLIEGEARLIDTMFDAIQDGNSPDRVLWSRVFSRYHDFMEGLLAETATPYTWAYSSSLYYYGSRWLHHQKEQHGQPVRLALINQDPISSADFFATPAELQPALRNSVNSEPPSPLDGYQIDYTTEMGPTMLYAFVRKLGMASWDATRLVSTWQGDLLHIYASKDGEEVVAAWRFNLARSDVRDQWLHLMETKLTAEYEQSPDHLMMFIGSPGVDYSPWISAGY